MSKLFDDTGPLPKGKVGPTGAEPSPEQSDLQSAAYLADAPANAAPTIGDEPDFGGMPELGIRSQQPIDNSADKARVICVINRKGGVGKTTVTFNLAGGLVELGSQVLVIDLDPMGSLCRSIGVFPKDPALSYLLIGGNGDIGSLVQPTHIQNLYVIPGDPNLRTFEMRHGDSTVYRDALRSHLDEIIQWKQFHYILIDCPPSLGLITGNAMAASHQALVPVDGSTYGMGALTDTLAIIRMMQQNVNKKLGLAGLVLNNVDLGTVYDRTVFNVMKRRMRGAMFETVIPTSPEADEASQLGEPVTKHAPSSWMAKAYRDLVGELIRSEPSRA